MTNENAVRPTSEKDGCSVHGLAHPCEACAVESNYVASTEALQARIAELEWALHELLDKCETSNDARYGTLGTSYVEQVARAALKEKP